MNKKLYKTLGLAILLASSLPFSLVSAETIEEVPTGETTISSIADDPLKEYKEKAANQVSSIEEPKSESKKETETQTTEDTPTTESSAEDTPDNEKKAKRQPRGGGGITPFSTNLIEGVDIDAGFAQYLRTYPNAVNNMMGTWSGHGKGQDQLTDEDMAAIKTLSINTNLSNLLGLEYAINMEGFSLNGGPITSIDFSNNLKLSSVNIGYCNSLTNIDISSNLELISVWISMCNNFDTLDVTNNLKLEYLSVYGCKLSYLDVSQNPALKELDYAMNKFSVAVDTSQNPLLEKLECSSNFQMTSIDVSQNPALKKFGCGSNQITNIDVSTNPLLEELRCYYTQITALDVDSNPLLRILLCSENMISSLNLTNNPKLEELDCEMNQLSDLDISQNPELVKLNCTRNSIRSLSTSNNPKLEELRCGGNSIPILNVSSNPRLKLIYATGNCITDISSALGLINLTEMDFGNQTIQAGVPTVTGGQATLDLLRTSAQSGLSVTNVSIPGSPIVVPNGDKIEFSNVTAIDLEGGGVSFNYDSTQLTEGSSSYSYKKFSGNIRFQAISQLSNNLTVDKKKVESSGVVTWTWKIKSLSDKKAERIHANFVLPSGAVIDSSSIVIDGVPGSISDIDGTNNLGDLNNMGDTKEITFKTMMTGSVDEWLEPIAKLVWEDDISFRDNQTKGAVQIQDDEQTYTPKDTDDMSIQSVPVYFNHGTNPIMSTAQTYHLHSMNYQSNTKVVTDGFYTRIKDDRAISTGWKLTAKLSDFKDSSNTPMPNGTGTSLKLENMSIERVTDRDTPQETINPSPTGADVPSSVQSTETIVAGQPTAKTLVTALPNQGQDTWQLRMPFDKISLNLPANAGKKGTVYKAKLTWSLDDTP